MIAVVPRATVVGIAVLGLAAAASAQEYGPSPNDLSGVGAQGKIGRGTSPGDTPSVLGQWPGGAPRAYVGVPTAAPAGYVYIYVQPTLPAAAPAGGESASAGAARPSASAPALARYNPYMGLARSWVHGYWNAHASDAVAWRLSAVARADAGGAGRAGAVPSAAVPEPGLGVGWGLPAWLIGPMVYRWGYYPYANPYVDGKPPGGGGVPDYSGPVRVLAAPPTQELLGDAIGRFTEARAAFRREEYPRALALLDESLALMPNDPAIHELRALTLVALGRYREAAAAYHAVIAVVPGWDWTTLIRLYDRPETYTRQLRALEVEASEHPGSAEARFLRAVLYLSMGYPDDAAEQLRELAGLLPDDVLGRQLLRELGPPGGDAVAPASAPAPARRGEAGKLEGTWTARPRAGTTILASFQARGQLGWDVRRPGGRIPSGGFYLYDHGILMLMQDQDNVLLGKVAWSDPRRFTFRILEAQPDDPGLSFERSP